MKVNFILMIKLEKEKKKFIKTGHESEGDFIDGKLHGKGVFKYSNGMVCEGDWKNGKLNGKGKVTYEDGSVGDGDWVEGVMHGKGKKNMERWKCI